MENQQETHPTGDGDFAPDKINVNTEAEDDGIPNHSLGRVGLKLSKRTGRELAAGSPLGSVSLPTNRRAAGPVLPAQRRALQRCHGDCDAQPPVQPRAA